MIPSESKTNVELLVTNGRIRTMDLQNRIFDPGAVAIDQGVITAIGPEAELTTQFSAARTWNAQGKLIMPGFINTHTHLFQTFLRGLGKDMALVDWLKASVRLYSPLLIEEDFYLAALVGCMDAIRSGTTTMLDYMYVSREPEFPKAVGRAFLDLGIRGIVGRGFSNLKVYPDGGPVGNYEPIDQALERFDELRNLYQDYPMVSAAMAPPSLWTIDRAGLSAIAEYSEKHNVMVTIHTAETDDNVEFCLEQHRERPFALLNDVGLLNDRFLAVHCVKLIAEDIDLLEQTGASVSHNPAANMVLASGVAPIPELLARGVKVGLATDGASSNDSTSLIEAMKLAALMQKVHHLDPAIMGAREVVAMATSMGAQAVGMGSEIGSLEAGKRADLVVLDMMKVNTAPVHDEIANLVYCGSSANVDTVIINGKFVLDAGHFTTVNEEEILIRATEHARRLTERAGGFVMDKLKNNVGC